MSCYATFVGHPRNGSTLLGALLDSHPDAVVCHELDALGLLRRGVNRNLFYWRHLRRSYWFHNMQGGQWSGYDYTVPGFWQGGRYRTLRVIGDKRARMAAVRLTDRPELVEDLAALTGARLAWIHVVRNPFDNLATMVTRKGRAVEDEADRFFARCRGIAALRERFPEDVIDVTHEDITSDPAAQLSRLCEHLGLDPEPDWLAAAAAIVRPSPSRTRDKIEWEESVVQSIRTRMKDFEWFAPYLDAPDERR